jgi:ribosomal protein S18 acetylase RimI-like enzyme
VLYGYNALVLKLRPYEPRDFERLVEIDHACFAEGVAYPAEEMAHFLSLRSATTLIGTDDVDIRGFIIADKFRSRRSRSLMGRIITIDVLPEAQGSGLGALLLTGAENKLRDQGCDYVSLEVAVNNERALRFYKKHGYSVLKVLPRYYLSSVDGLLMGKKL